MLVVFLRGWIGCLSFSVVLACSYVLSCQYEPSEWSRHILPVLRQLHWLPVRQRVHFKMAAFVHQSLSGVSPSYLADDCRLVTAARLVTGTRRSNHISPVLRQLHWLPVRQRVHFKMAAFVHQSLSGISPSYLADDCCLVANACEWRLRSTARRTCVVTRTYSTFSNRAFSAAGPGLWNSLPLHLKDADLSYNELRRSLKTFLFGQWAHGAV